MGLSAEQLRASLDAIASREPAFAVALGRVGYPEPRIRERGYVSMLRTIVGQQISFLAAASIWRKLEGVVGDLANPESIGRAGDEALRAAGLSRQKAAYARSLAAEVLSGRLDFARLPKDDEDAITALTRIQGIGRWSAEIYLLFAEGRPDIWPAGDLALRIGIGRILAYPERPTEKYVRAVAEAWRPHRGAAAIFAWHHYKAEVI